MRKTNPYGKPMMSFEKGHAAGRTGKHGGPKVDRFEKRKRKTAEASRRRNRR